MAVDSKSKPFRRQEPWGQRGWGSVLRPHSFIRSGSPHSPPQGPLHFTGWCTSSSCLLIFWKQNSPFASENNCSEGPAAALSPAFSPPGDTQCLFLSLRKGWLTPSTTVPTKLDSKYTSKKGSKHYLKSYFPEIGPNSLVLLWLSQFTHTHTHTLTHSHTHTHNANLSNRIFRSNFTTWNASFLTAESYFKTLHWGLKGERVWNDTGLEDAKAVDSDMEV